MRLACHDSGGVAGEGAPLLCIHGNSCDHGFFVPLVGHFRSMRRVVAVDLRGHGRSDAPPGEYAFTTFAEDCAAVLDSLETGPCVVVGHSMGGAVACELAVRRPELVRSLALLDSTLQPPGPELAATAAALLRKMDAGDVTGPFDRFFDSLFLPAGKGRCSAEFKRALHERMLRTPAHVMRALMSDLAIFSGSPVSRVRELGIGLHYLAGERRRTDPAWLAREYPQARYDRLPGLGHFLMLEDPEAVSGWLDRVLVDMC